MFIENQPYAQPPDRFLIAVTEFDTLATNLTQSVSPTMYPMKSYCSFLILSLLPISLTVAQSGTTTRPKSATTTQPSTTSRPAVKPPATRPAATDTQTQLGEQTTTTTPTTNPNRRQELYDQYHGINKKPVTPTTTSSPASSRPASRVATETEAPKPTMTETASRNQTSAAASPDGNSSNVRIGFRGGVTYLIYTEDNPVSKPSIGFVGGITFNFGKGLLSFQPEINYARYSTKVSIPGFSAKGAADLVEIPLFLKISSGTYEGNRFFLNVGPYAAYQVSQSVDGKTISLEGVKGRFGFGGALGIGTALKAGPGHVTIEVRGHYPLGDFDNGFQTDANTILAQGTVGYIFPLGGR